MTKKKTLRKRIAKKLLSRYRMVVINEKTFEEQLQFRLSRLNLIIVGVLLLASMSIGTFMVIAYTPLKEYIPEYDSSAMRKQALENYFKTDSLIKMYEKNIQYLNTVKGTLTGEFVFENDSSPTDSGEQQADNFNYKPITIKEDSIIRKIVEQEDKYNISQSFVDEVEGLFFPPAKGSISEGFNLEDKHYAVDIVLNENDPVKSIGDGIVVFVGWTTETGYVIMIEHINGMLSVYKHNSLLNKEQGDRVVAGEVIAQAGNTGEFSTGWHLHFELWMEGYPMNPENFFDFQ